MPNPTILDFLYDDQLLARYFEGPSWRPWKAVFKAAFGLADEMIPGERHDFRKFAGGRRPPKKQVRELVCAIGRGGGKDSAASAIATYLACTSDFSRLRPGEKGTILCLANGREQARIAYSYIRGYFEQTPLLAPLIRRADNDTIELTNRAQIIVLPNNYRAPRGLTIVAAIYDECAFWFDQDYANPDIETDTAVSPGLMRFPGSMKIMISSVNKRSGLLYDRVAKYYGKNSDDVLVVKGTSLDFNCTLDAEVIQRELERDYERASAEYLSEWRDDLTTFLDRELVEAALDRGVTVRPPQPAFKYVSFSDPSGGRGDSFTAAIAHTEGNLLILDHVSIEPTAFVISWENYPEIDLDKMHTSPEFGKFDEIFNQFRAQFGIDQIVRGGFRIWAFSTGDPERRDHLAKAMRLLSASQTQLLNDTVGDIARKLQLGLRGIWARPVEI